MFVWTGFSWATEQGIADAQKAFEGFRLAKPTAGADANLPFSLSSSPTEYAPAKRMVVDAMQSRKRIANDLKGILTKDEEKFGSGLKGLADYDVFLEGNEIMVRAMFDMGSGKYLSVDFSVVEVEGFTTI